MCNNTISLLESFIEIGSSVSPQNYTFYRPLIFILPLFQFICPLFHFEISQNIDLFLKIIVINLLIFLLYPYFIFKNI